MTANNEFFLYEETFHEYLEKKHFTTVKKEHYQYIVFEGVQIPFVPRMAVNLILVTFKKMSWFH